VLETALGWQTAYIVGGSTSSAGPLMSRPVVRSRSTAASTWGYRRKRALTLGLSLSARNGQRAEGNPEGRDSWEVRAE
jgi:hypothetical protein